ncbi:hypothetical protein EDC04DRAFT_3060936 [Pisolithus marmoratus]|nr:hypothetical protein EDC04DRAFT_3060936 [Pisolithus marmoratus]
MYSLRKRRLFPSVRSASSEDITTPAALPRPHTDSSPARSSFIKHLRSVHNRLQLSEAIVVFIVGPSGLGKSGLLDILLQDENIKVHSNSNQELSTPEIKTRMCRFKGIDSRIILVDTPSFDTCGGLDGREIMKERITLNYNEECKAAGILYLHNVASSSDDPRLWLSPYLDDFRRVFPEGRAPSTVHVVPTMFGKEMPSESIKASMTQLRCEVDGVRASMLEKLFDWEPRTALNAVTYLSRKAEWETLDRKIEVQRIRLEDEPPGKPSYHKALVLLSDLLLQRYRCQYWHMHGEKEKKHDLDEIITLRQRALNCAPRYHPNFHSAVVSLVNILSERFEKEGDRRDLDEMITLRRTALEHSRKGHREHLDSLVNLANCLAQSFRLTGATEDLTEVITLRRAVLEITPSGHERPFAYLVDLAESPDQRLKSNEGTVVDLEEIIVLRRAALECTSPAPVDQCMSLVSLASYLREKVQRSGGMKTLNEAITHALAALALCPPEFYSVSRDCLTRCVELKLQHTLAGIGQARTSSSSSVKEAIWKIVSETVKTMPLRLLNTRTGILCNRVAQLSNFESSREYKQLLASTSNCNGQQIEALIRKAVLAFFCFATLSHRWEDDEPLLRDVEGRSVYTLEGKSGLPKLQKFCLLALKHEYVWAWSDTCCIDKESSAELQEAIGSMFSWYRHSALTIVHLSDVSDETSFTDSIWFKRGWTLQELLAPHTILFYTQDWLPYMNCESSNHKMDSTVLKDLHRASGIAEWHLRNFKPGIDDARSRLEWASSRRTTRPEDVAYSLFGVFNLHLPVLYGKSTDNAIGRLLAVIISQSGDVSVLDWVGEASSFHSCFPANLTPYQITPCARSTSSDPGSGHTGVDLERARKLWSGLAELPFPQFINHTLSLPSIVHQVTVVKAGETSSSQSHAYEIHASGLVRLQLVLSVKLCEGSQGRLPYVLVRPWHAKLLDVLEGDGNHAPLRLLEQLGQPFNALLLRELRGRQYKRIAADCMITCRAQDLSSIAHSEIQTLHII